jgi:hypothetical protein
MFDTVINGLAAIRANHPWVSQVAAILPLCSLIDFIDVPLKLHALQLTGATPLWSWAITPSGSRLLLPGGGSQSNCHLDQYGNSVSLIGVDGMWGDKYLVPSPETTRLCLGTQPVRTIENPHMNMTKPHLRLQNLEIVHVLRLSPDQSKGHVVDSFWAWIRRYSGRYMVTSILGWICLFGLIILGVVSNCYLAVAFLIIVPLSGSIVSLMYGNRPRKLLVTSTSDYNRLVVVAENMNTSDWTVFYGESTIVNSLLNRPLEPNRSKGSTSVLGRLALRILIFGQWAIAIGASATADWNAFYISFWIMVGIFAHAYLIPPRIEVGQWMKSSGGIRMERFRTQLSSRRALLNTIMALNPDTFGINKTTKEEDHSVLFPGALKWIDSVLEAGPARTRWQEATRAAMAECPTGYTEEQLKSPQYWDIEGSFLSEQWRETYNQEGDYWKPFVCEGIVMASKIVSLAKLSGRFVNNEKV